MIIFLPLFSYKKTDEGKIFPRSNRWNTVCRVTVTRTKIVDFNQSAFFLTSCPDKQLDMPSHDANCFRHPKMLERLHSSWRTPAHYAQFPYHNGYEGLKVIFEGKFRGFAERNSLKSIGQYYSPNRRQSDRKQTNKETCLNDFSRFKKYTQ